MIICRNWLLPRGEPNRAQIPHGSEPSAHPGPVKARFTEACSAVQTHHIRPLRTSKSGAYPLIRSSAKPPSSVQPSTDDHCDVVGKLLRPELRFELLSGFQNMPTNGFRTQPVVDGQHIMQQRTDRREGDLRATWPAGTSVVVTCAPPGVRSAGRTWPPGIFRSDTGANVGPAQVDIPEGGAQAQRVAPLIARASEFRPVVCPQICVERWC